MCRDWEVQRFDACDVIEIFTSIMDTYEIFTQVALTCDD